MRTLLFSLVSLLCLLLPRVAAQVQTDILAMNRDGHAIFDVRNVGNTPAAFVPLEKGTLKLYSLRGEGEPPYMGHPSAVYTSLIIRPYVTPPLLLAPGEGRRYEEDFGPVYDFRFEGRPRVGMQYCFDLDARNRLLRTAKCPMPHTAAMVQFWQELWPKAEPCLVETMEALPLELPPDLLICPEEEGKRLPEAIALTGAELLPGEDGALRLRFRPRLSGEEAPELPLPDVPERAACYSLLVEDAGGRKERWAARPGGTPQSEKAGLIKLDVLPPSPEARAALEGPVLLRLLCVQGECSFKGSPFYALPAYWTSRTPWGEDVVRARGLTEEPSVPVEGEAAEPELELVSIEELGRALLTVSNRHGKKSLCLPRSGCAEAAPAYRLHVADASGRETIFPALVDTWNALLLRQTEYHLIPPGVEELVEVDFVPLPEELLRRAQRAWVSVDVSRCMDSAAAPAEGYELLPPLTSLARPTDAYAWTHLSSNGNVVSCELQLLSLDLKTGRAICEISNGGGSRERAYFRPGMLWGDSCFSLRVRDEQGRELRWDIRRDYMRNMPQTRSLMVGDVAHERVDFGFIPAEGQVLTEAQSDFLAALRRPGAQVRVVYHMTQACFLSADFGAVFIDPLLHGGLRTAVGGVWQGESAEAYEQRQRAEAAEHFESMRRLLLRGMRSEWQRIDPRTQQPIVPRRDGRWQD